MMLENTKFRISVAQRVLALFLVLNVEDARGGVPGASREHESHLDGVRWQE
jgi:hypothetical protein